MEERNTSLMEEALRKELSKQPGVAYIAVKDPDEKLLKQLREVKKEENIKIVTPFYSDKNYDRVALAVLDAIVVGERAVVYSTLNIKVEQISPGIYARTSVVKPLKNELKRLWKFSIPLEDLPKEKWRKKRSLGEIYVKYSFPYRPSSLPKQLENLRKELYDGYDDPDNPLRSLEKNFWTHIHLKSLSVFIDSLEIDDLPKNRLKMLINPDKYKTCSPSLPGKLKESLKSWVENITIDEVSALETVGYLSRRLSRGGSVGKGLMFIVASLQENSPIWRDRSFGAGCLLIIGEFSNSGSN